MATQIQLLRARVCTQRLTGPVTETRNKSCCIKQNLQQCTQSEKYIHVLFDVKRYIKRNISKHLVIVCSFALNSPLAHGLKIILKGGGLAQCYINLTKGKLRHSWFRYEILNTYCQSWTNELPQTDLSMTDQWPEVRKPQSCRSFFWVSQQLPGCCRNATQWQGIELLHIRENKNIPKG